MRVTFTVPGKPQGKGRPRASRDGHMYTPKKTREYETLIAMCYRMKGGKLFEGYIQLDITALYPLPKSMSKADKQRAVLGELLPDKKPDGDNIEKAVADALNGVAYEDDRQIVSASWKKRYAPDSEHAGLLITLANYTSPEQIKQDFY